jgi:transporter family-2 protein
MLISVAYYISGMTYEPADFTNQVIDGSFGVYKLKHMKAVWLVIVFIAGALLPLQAGLNARFGKSIDSPLFASLISFMVGALCIALYIPFTKESLSWSGLRSTPLPYWLGGGLTGAFFITVSLLALPRIGMALTFGLIVAGQVIIAVVLDHYNVLVAAQHSFNVWRLLGIVLIILGVVIVRKF